MIQNKENNTYALKFEPIEMSWCYLEKKYATDANIHRIEKYKFAAGTLRMDAWINQ